MPSPIQAWKAAVEAEIVALVPESDGTASVYDFIDDLIDERGDGQHRKAIWRLARSVDEESTHYTQRRWVVPLEVFIHRQPTATYETTIARAENEANAIMDAHNAMTSFGTDVLATEILSVAFDEPEPRDPPRSGGIPKLHVITIRFLFSVLAGTA